MKRSKSSRQEFRKKRRLSEFREIELLTAWIESGKPDPGSNPLSQKPLPENAQSGHLSDGTFSSYTGTEHFKDLPISKHTKEGLSASKYIEMTDIQRASLPHSLCGRDILGAAKTGSGKTLAFVIPVLEKLYRERWGPEDGVGSIIISPTRELALQLFHVLQYVGKYHSFSAGLLIGGRNGVDTEKERVNELNILVCTPGRLVQHMDETLNFECSQLQILVLDEADRILDDGFKKELNAIVSQLPEKRQTLLFSATQTKSVRDLARLSLKDPEYLGVHEESVTATPNQLLQIAVIVPLDQKLDMLWAFLKSHLKSKILVFLSTVKQVRFVFEAFKKLKPGIPLKCLHGRMKQERRLITYSDYSERHSVLFATDVASRGLDFDKPVDWVLQVDCPDDVETYIHRVGRTARYVHDGKSLLFLAPSEAKMLQKLQERRIPITVKNARRGESVSNALQGLMVKYPEMKDMAGRAFKTYMRSLHMKRDKEVFDVLQLPIQEFSASLGLPIPPKLSFVKKKNKENARSPPSDDDDDDDICVRPEHEDEGGESLPPPRPADTPSLPNKNRKKKKLKINIHRPSGTRVVFDDQGTPVPPLALMADTRDGHGGVPLTLDGVKERYARMKAQLKAADVEDKVAERLRRREKRFGEKLKWRKQHDGGDHPGTCSNKMYFDSDGDDDVDGCRSTQRGMSQLRAAAAIDSITLSQQEDLALQLLSSMH